MTADRHLNLFYSYNRDEELVENNLTRSLIVTLMGMSADTRGKILSSLGTVFAGLNLEQAKFSLQNNSPPDPRRFGHKYVVTLAADDMIEGVEKHVGLDNKHVALTLANQVAPAGSCRLLSSICGRSIPDAWIYDASDRQEYCFLIECKTQSDSLYFSQIIRHAYQHYGWDDLQQIRDSTISLTWDDVLEAIASLDRFDNAQEELLVTNLVQYLGYFGHSLFRGFRLADLPCPRSFDLSIAAKVRSLEDAERLVQSKVSLFRFEEMESVPSISLSELPGKSLFRFELMPMQGHHGSKVGGSDCA